MPSEVRRDTVKIGNLLSVAEQIQAFGLARKTGEIFITNVPPPARINLIDGAVVDAQFGMKTGVEAAVALINLPDSHSEFIVGERAARQTIDMPFVQLLCEAAMAQDHAAKKDKPSTEPMRPVPGNPYLRITLGGETQTFSIKPGIATVGRATMNDLVLNEPTVSQRHASLEYSRHGVLVKDLGSTNGTYVAGKRISEKWLSLQESLQFGSVHCLYIGGVKKTASTD